MSHEVMELSNLKPLMLCNQSFLWFTLGVFALRLGRLNPVPEIEQLFHAIKIHAWAVHQFE
jgi:hypothetical protein